ncbi:MAG TPA: 3-hydroxybutyrate oligomer hydrolase family protein [Kofleriaceae bacterium]|nr:3-hydroxybutyrate oligomer hydrolase family protein [Kofleriaceae bacterium]
MLPPRITNIVGPTTYDGVTDDLLTGGLGTTKLGSTTAPGFVDPANPTAAELRTRAIYTNYRAVLDATVAGGYSVLYGPNIDVTGHDTLGEGLIAGTELLAYADDGTGKQNVTVMVQIPASFDKTHPCIVTAPSSGSRGIYGAIGSAGDWGLKHGCAVAYTDAGKGIGYQDLATNKVNLIDGRLMDRATAGNLAHFALDLGDGPLAAFNTAFPNRIAYKHVYSQQNPEKAWGQNVLDSVRLAFWALNEAYSPVDGASQKHTKTIVPDNTIVITSSISNGGGESLQAVEQDTEGLIDGIAVTEPNAQPASMTGVTVNFNGAAVPNAGKPLIDYFTYRMLYEPCAAISPKAQAPNGVRPGWFGFGTDPLGSALTQVGGVELKTVATGRCQSLADKGLITGGTTDQQADAALAKLLAYGWTDPLNNALHASHYRLADMYVAFGYVAAYGKFSVADDICGFSLANIDAAGHVAPQAATQTSLFGTSNGLNSGAEVIYDDSMAGPILYHLGVSPSTHRLDGALDGELCMRNMVTGVDTVTGAPLTGVALLNSLRVQAGMHDVLLSGNLHGRPAVIIQGRSDTLLPVNHASRAYVAFNSKIEGGNNVHYYEIENGNHFDAFIPNLAGGGVQGYDTLLVPVHYYFINGMDLMWAKLTGGADLPASQVVRTTPRGGTPGSAPPITTTNVPKIAATPAAGDTITSAAGVINVPN